jgi:hypothetical protein
MLADIRLTIAASEARLVLKRGDKHIEDEVWVFSGKLSRSAAADISEAAFHDLYDLIQYAVHGDDETG